jgi:hypothetical protein
MSRIERRIAMIQDTLKNGELAPEQAVRLTTELNDLLSMADTDTFVDAMQRSREVAQSKNETKPLQPRGRKPRAAYVTGTADRVTPQGPVDVKTAAVTDFATSLKAATGAVSVTVNDDPVTVTVGEVKPVTFKRLYNNSWGQHHRGDGGQSARQAKQGRQSTGVYRLQRKGRCPMKFVELTIRRNGRITGREVARLENEGVTLSGKYPTRKAELEAAGYSVDRQLRNTLPTWAKAGAR